MILSVTLNPCIDQTLFIDGLKPHDSNRVLRTETDAGGKGINLSRVAVELGGESLATGFLGGGGGAYIKRVLDAQGVKHDFVEIQGNTRTNFSVEDGTGAPPTVFNAKGPTIAPEEWSGLIASVTQSVKKVQWVAMGGSLPKGVPIEAYHEIGLIAKQAGARLALDADGEALRRGLDAKPHFVKPNRKEAGRLLGRNVESVEEAVFAAEELLQYLEPDGVCVVSLGAEGAVLATQKETLIGRGIEVEAVSTIGSGDSLAGAMLASLESGASLMESFRLGLAAGAATAMTDGAEIARRDVVETLVSRAHVESAH